MIKIFTITHFLLGDHLFHLPLKLTDLSLQNNPRKIILGQTYNTLSTMIIGSSFLTRHLLQPILIVSNILLLLPADPINSLQLTLEALHLQLQQQEEISCSIRVGVPETST